MKKACTQRLWPAIQQMLGHWNVGTTMRYVTPSSTFVEDAYRRAESDTLHMLGDEDESENESENEE